MYFTIEYNKRENIVKNDFDHKIISNQNIDFCNIVINKIIDKIIDKMINEIDINKTNNFVDNINNKKNKKNEIINIIVVNFFDFLLCFVCIYL